MTDGWEDGRLDVGATTMDEQFVGLCRRIDRLQALVQAGAAVGASPRIRLDLDALHEGQASVLAAARRAPDEVEETIGHLEARLAVTENAALADVSDDWKTFAAGVEAELRSWNTYLDRVQASVAANGWMSRGRAETAISDFRTRRTALYAQLRQAADSAGNDRQEHRDRVTAARDELARKADELSATARAPCG